MTCVSMALHLARCEPRRYVSIVVVQQGREASEGLAAGRVGECCCQVVCACTGSDEDEDSDSTTAPYESDEDAKGLLLSREPVDSRQSASQPYINININIITWCVQFI